MDLAIKKFPLKLANVCNISKSSCNISTYASYKMSRLQFRQFFFLYNIHGAIYVLKMKPAPKRTQAYPEIVMSAQNILTARY